jgi:hypothetical protein
MTYEIIDGKIIITSTYHNATLIIPTGVDGDTYAQNYIAKYIKTFEELAAMKAEEIKSAFESAAMYGRFTSVLGFDVDARRGGVKNDLQNIEVLIDIGATEFRDANNIVRNVTTSDLATIKTEMQQYGMSLYAHKWDLEAELENAETEEDLNAIQW